MRKVLVSVTVAGALSIGGCASNYAGEGALAGGAAGAVIGAGDGDVGEGALIGAAIGALGGTLIKKGSNRDCFRVDSEGRRYRSRDC